MNAVNSASVSEERFSGSVISAKATVVSGTIDYSIVGGNEGNVFSIDSDGLISQNQKLDYETMSEYKLAVRATKQGSSPPLVAERVFTIKVDDANDNSPEFNVNGNSIEVKIGKDSGAGTVVSMVSAM